MRVLSQTDRIIIKDAVIPLTTINVCMHVLGIASTDARVMRAATALVNAGYKVTLIDIEDEESNQSKENICGVFMKHIVASHSFLSTRFDKWTIIRLAQLFVRCTFQLIQMQADIYHAHDVSALPACYIAACLHRKPIIFEAHEMPLFERPLSEMGRSRRWVHKLLVVLLTHIVPRCAGIITVSPPIVEEIRSRYRVPEVTLIRNLPEYRAVSKGDRLRPYLGLSSDIRIALYQGNLQPDRGLDRLVRAATFLERDIVIVMMGKNDGTTQAQLEALIAKEGVEDRVKILPPVPYAELLDWTASADIGLNVASPDHSLNARWALPNKLFEYLMAGLPVLGSQLVAVVEVIRNYDVGQVFPSLEPDTAGSAINAMLADSASLARMRHNALEAAKREFNWEKEKVKLLHLYQRVCTTNCDVQV